MIEAISQRILLILFGILLAVPALANDQARATEKLRAVQGEIERLQEKLEGARGRQGKLEGELRRVDREIGKATRELKQIEKELRQAQQRLSTLRAQRADQLAALEQQRGLLAQQVRAAYAGGQQARLKLLLNQQDPAAVGRVLAYYDYFHQARVARINAVESTLTDLRRTEKEIGEETAGLEAARTAQQARKEALLAGKRERERVLAELGKEIRSADQQLATLKEDEKRLKDLLASLSRVIEDLPLEGDLQPFAKLKGQLPWPTNGVVKARFGQERGQMGAHLSWQGVLIGAPEGHPVKAISHGRVVFADWMRGFGLLVIVDHGNGYMSLYGHNQGLYKTVGDWVEPGEVVGSAGLSGGHTEASVYFEIRHQGKPLDPAGWCRGSVAMAGQNPR